MTRPASARARRLRRIAAIEIARHRDREGFLGAALDGSLATGALWPSSDLDFTIVPLPEAPRQQGVEWGQRGGIIWHKHIIGRQLLLDLVEGYPESFVRPAAREFSFDANWFLDGVAVMEVLDDPEGLLTESKRFVAAHRFAPEVCEGRRAALLAELRRQRDVARTALERGEAETACDQLRRGPGLATVAAQIWLEGARRIYSSKEQDGLLAEVTQAAGWPHVHELYRATIGVEPGRAEAAAPLIHQLGESGAGFYLALRTFPRKYRREHGRPEVWAAWIRHHAEKLVLAPDRGHPAYVYQQLHVLLYWTVDSPRRDAEAMRQKGVPGAETLAARAAEAAQLSEELRAVLLGPAPAATRARVSLAAAEKLIALTEARA